MDILANKHLKQKFSGLKTKATALDVGRNSTSWAQSLVKPAIPEELGYPHMGDVRLILGLGRQPHINSFASNIAVRGLLIPAIVEILLQTWSLLLERQMHLLTIAPGDWHIDEMEPILRPDAWRKEAWRWLKAVGLNGIGVVELAPYLNHPSARAGRVISPHLHAVGFAEDEATYEGKVDALNQRFGDRNIIGAFAVNRPVLVTEADLAMVAYYLLEPLHHAKRLSPSRDQPGKFRPRKAELPFSLALRCSEIMSYLSLTDLLITRGGVGWRWRQDLLASLGPALSARPLVSEDLDDLWSAVWKAQDRQHYSRVHKLSD